MGRRKSDKFQFRLLVLSLALSASLAVLASVIGFKAISAINQFVEAMEQVAYSRSLKRF